MEGPTTSSHDQRLASRGKGKELPGGAKDLITAYLEPGSYELVCFLPGHHAAGQKLPFEVTG